MTLKYANRVKETTQTQGTGTINLDGSSTGFQTFAEGVPTGSKVGYFIFDDTNWEHGIGTVTAGSPDTLARDTVIESTNGNSAVNWGPGTRNVILAASPHLQVWRDEKLNHVSMFGTDSGSVNAHVVTLAYIPLGYSDGMEVVYFPNGTNSSTTVNTNIGSLGNKRIKIRGLDPVVGSIKADKPLHLRYKNSSGWFEVQNLEQPVGAAKGTAIASAGTVDIGSADSDYISITGTTTITSFGSSTSRNRATLKFDGVLTLTHNATSLILPGGANIKTAAGDIAEFVRVSGSNWECISFQRAAIAPIGAGMTAYTPAYTGLGTVSGSNVRYSRNGSFLEIVGYVVSGTATGVEARISLPSGLTVLSGINSPSVVGSVVLNLNLTGSVYLLAEPGAAYLCFSVSSTSTNGMTKSLGTDFAASGRTIAFTARVPIETW